MAEERIDIVLGGIQQAIKGLEDLDRKIEDIRRKSGNITLGGGLSAAVSGFGLGLAGAAGQTGAAISNFAQADTGTKIATAIEQALRTWKPDWIAKLDELGIRSRAEARTAGVIEQGERLGYHASDAEIREINSQALQGERRAADARARVGSVSRRSFLHDVGNFFEGMDYYIAPYSQKGLEDGFRLMWDWYYGPSQRHTGR